MKSKTFQASLMSLLTIAAVALCSATAQAEDQSEVPGLVTEGYLAHNYWFEKPQKVYAINYKRGTMLQAGEKVSGIKASSRGRHAYVDFHHDELGMDFRIYVQAKYDPNLSVGDFQRRTFTSKTLKQLTKGLSKIDKEGIEAGTVLSGMTKEGVLIAWGPPPSHRTPSLNLPTWTYWPSRFVSKAVAFSDNTVK